ncbi:MAG: zinc finger Ran-binding domain-containing protein [Chthoniobacteraceae bacterium]
MADQLICGACGFSNEPERVYCHSCGAKLDRSLLPVVEQEKNQESAESARRRIKKMTNPGGYGVGQFLKSLILTLLWAALFASLFLVSQKPDDVPEDKNEIPTRLVQSELMEATQSPVPRTIAFTEAEVNATLKQSLKRAAGPSGVPGIEFQRAFATLKPNILHIGAQQTVWGYPVYSGVDYRLTVVSGKFTPIMVGGNFGRLHVPLEAMKYLDVAFAKLWTALKREHEQVDKMQSVQIGQGQIVFVTKGAGAR